MGKWTDEALRMKPFYQKGAQSLEDDEALEVKGIYFEWEELLDENHEYHTVKKGFKFRHGNTLYKTEQPEFTFIENYVPGNPGTESLFAEIDETHAGTKEDPIPYGGNMALVAGLYYSQAGVIYYCWRDTGTAVYNPLSELVGLYVEEVEV